MASLLYLSNWKKGRRKSFVPPDEVNKKTGKTGDKSPA
jgi:hypothetical protein